MNVSCSAHESVQGGDTLAIPGREIPGREIPGREICNSYSRGVQTERLLREPKHNFGACLSRQRYLPTNPKKTRVQNWTDLGSNLPIPFMAVSSFWLRGLRSGWPGESARALQLATTKYPDVSLKYPPGRSRNTRT